MITDYRKVGVELADGNYGFLPAVLAIASTVGGGYLAKRQNDREKKRLKKQQELERQAIAAEQKRLEEEQAARIEAQRAAAQKSLFPPLSSGGQALFFPVLGLFAAGTLAFLAWRN